MGANRCKELSTTAMNKGMQLGTAALKATKDHAMGLAARAKDEKPAIHNPARIQAAVEASGIVALYTMLTGDWKPVYLVTAAAVSGIAYKAYNHFKPKQQSTLNAEGLTSTEAADKALAEKEGRRWRKSHLSPV